MVERRKSQRMPALNTGAVSARFGRGTECTLRNISDGGACLVFVNRQTALPREFTLTVQNESAGRTCRLVWQSAYRVGVQFVSGS